MSSAENRESPAESERTARALSLHALDNLLEGCQVISPEFRYLYVNGAAAAHGRTSRERLLGRTMMELYPGIEETEMFARLRDCLNQGTAHHLENEFRFPDGKTGWFELRIEPVPAGVAVLSIDITERKRAEAALRRSTRALLTLSECHAALLRATDERRFLFDVCRVAVERGGYRRAWIGLPGQVHGAPLRTVARWRQGDREEDAELATEGATEPCQDIAVEALRTARPNVAHVRHAPADGAAPGRAAEPPAGSTIALPIRSRERVVGVFTLEAGESDAFDEAERALLDEVALDLRYGLESLRERHAWRTLLGNLPGMACRREGGPDGRLQLVSEGCRDLTGYDAAELLRDSGLRYAELVHPADRERLAAAVGHSLATGTGYVVEYRILTLPGELRWVWEKGTAIFAADGTVAAFDGFVTDVTERRRAEETVQRLNARLERLTRVVQDLSSARTLADVTAIVRHAARELTGAAGATFVLRDGDQCHYVDEEAIAPLWKGKRFPLAACISGWAMLHRQAVAIADIFADPRVPQDAYRPTFVQSLVMVPIRGADPIGAIGCYWDRRHEASADEVDILRALADSTSVALENVRALGELAESSARVRAIYDHLPIATFVWQRRGDDFELVDGNEAARLLAPGHDPVPLGCRPAELESAFPGIGADLERCFAQRARVVRETAEPTPGESETRRLVLTYGSVLTDTVILHVDDVTERRRIRERLETAQRLEAVGRLAGGIAHDFNNLLSVILSYSEFALAALRESDPARADVAEVRKAGERAATLTRQLLALSRKQVLEPAVLDLNEIVRNVAQMLRRLLGEDVEVVADLAPDLGSVEADPGQLEQVLMNLAVNARDAMPRGGRLTLATMNVEFGEEWADRHGELAAGRYVELSVADTGTGMDAETRAHVFEPFFTTKEKGRGTGLGLATVYGIVKQSGGHICFYSEPDLGTVFRAYLPRVDATPRDLARPADDQVEHGHETVLVVEDEEAVRDLVVRILEEAGYRVLAAGDGEEALAVSARERQRVDLLLSDVIMPRMDGRELVRRITTVCPHLQVLFVSGYADEAVGREGLLAPGVHFLAKPFSAAALTRAVRRALDDAPPCRASGEATSAGPSAEPDPSSPRRPRRAS